MRESAIYQEIRHSALQEGVQQGRQEGRQEGEAILVLRLLTRRLGQIVPELRLQIQRISVAQLEELGEALLDFSSTQDLTDWLQARVCLTSPERVY